MNEAEARALHVPGEFETICDDCDSVLVMNPNVCAFYCPKCDPELANDK